MHKGLGGGITRKATQTDQRGHLVSYLATKSEKSAVSVQLASCCSEIGWALVCPWEMMWGCLCITFFVFSLVPLLKTAFVLKPSFLFCSTPHFLFHWEGIAGKQGPVWCLGVYWAKSPAINSPPHKIYGSKPQYMIINRYWKELWNMQHYPNVLKC